MKKALLILIITLLTLCTACGRAEPNHDAFFDTLHGTTAVYPDAST